MYCNYGLKATEIRNILMRDSSLYFSYNKVIVQYVVATVIMRRTLLEKIKTRESYTGEASDIVRDISHF